MGYSRDRQGVSCQQCRRKVTLVRCSNCKGKGDGMTTQCSWCPGDGYGCENQKDRFHQYKDR